MFLGLLYLFRQYPFHLFDSQIFPHSDFSIKTLDDLVEMFTYLLRIVFITTLDENSKRVLTLIQITKVLGDV